MKRMLFTIVAAAVSLLAFTGAASAQSNLDVRASVPFSFVVDNHVLPAGDYQITQLRPTLIVLHNADTAKSATALTLFDRPEKGATGNPALIFHRYGNEYFLAQVIANNTQEARQLLTSSAEKKLSKEQGMPQLAIVRISGEKTKSGD